MGNKKKKWSIGIAVVMIIIIAFAVYTTTQKKIIIDNPNQGTYRLPEKLVRLPNNNYIIEDKDITNTTKMNNNIKYNVYTYNPGVTSKYLIGEKWGNLKYGGRYTSYQLDIYDASEQMNFIKSIDLMRALKNYEEGYTLTRGKKPIEQDGKYYYKISCYPTSNPDAKNIALYFNIEDESIVKESDMIIAPDNYLDDFFFATNFNEQTKSNIYIGKMDANNDYSYLYKPDGSVSINNIIIYEKYPEIKQYLQQKKNNITVYFFEEIPFEELLTYLLPNGANPFENVSLKAEYSKDGQEHKIISKEEFLQWYKPKEY